MGTVYSKCEEDVLGMGDVMMRKYHGELAEAGVNIAYLFAENPHNPAVTVGGYPCAAKVKVIGLKERADGRADAEIIIDRGHWEEAYEDRRRALVDHELEHLVLVKDNNGLLKRDDLNRPKLRLLKHDHQFGWFDSIARRHGDAAFEVKQAKEFADNFGQLYFGWKSPPDRPVESGIPVAAKKAAKALKKIVDSPGGGVTSIAFQAGDGPMVTIAVAAPQPGRVYAPQELGIDLDQLTACRHEHLLTGIQTNSVPIIATGTTLAIAGTETPWIAVLADPGEQADVRLLPLLAPGDEMVDDGYAYTGGLVTFAGEKRVLGSRDSGYLVRV